MNHSHKIVSSSETISDASAHDSTEHHSKRSFNSFKAAKTKYCVCGSLIRPVTVARDLGVILQSDLSMKDHVARTVSCCFRQLRLLKGCIKSLPFEAARAAVAAFVTSQVDRYNSLLVGAPKYLLDCLQSVLNAAARLLFNRRK